MYKTILYWCSEFRSLCESLNLESLFANLSDININTFKDRVYGIAEIQWRQWVERKPKLRIYKTYKTELSPELYVTKNIYRYKSEINDIGGIIQSYYKNDCMSFKDKKIIKKMKQYNYI